MINIILISIVAFGILVFELRYLIKRKLWGEMWAVIALMALGFVLAAGPSMGLTLPRTPRLIMRLSTALWRLLGIQINSE